MIAANRIAPAIVDADTINPERILSVISIPNAPFAEVLMQIFDCIPRAHFSMPITAAKRPFETEPPGEQFGSWPIVSVPKPQLSVQCA
jgi:hypothetical protein